MRTTMKKVAAFVALSLLMAGCVSNGYARTATASSLYAGKRKR
ncbi:hypothetical protein WRSd3_01422 [Shigella dysenteriae WRSd3]|uniref:Lipoprotein n=2 Tax=Shigella dysenteriae TaxID=622 RepID=A0A090NJU4_SHIDY|nr:hypothetical protein Asd1617_01942 [Shigella dysenteriae 1617]ESU80501.1 hypothetical protein WRSd3_01422 [Shigella dysenteriae WRSd3]ESU84765.1 hypothetical protein WRSd5_00445 [Shigella dysenteriae WRSd5]